MALTKTQIQIIKRCQADPAFFIENFCTIRHPVKGLIPFKLFSYQRRALKSYVNNRFNIYKKCRQCFSGESMVWTPNGPKRIDSLKLGDKVYSYNEKEARLVVVGVNQLFNNGVRKTVTVRTKSGHKARVTPDHEYLTRRGWVQAQYLTQNDIIIEVNDPQRYGAGNAAEAILLGYLLSDGYLGNKSIHFTNTTWRYLLEYQKHFEIQFNKKVKIRPHNKKQTESKGYKNAYRIESCLSEARDWANDLKILGKTAKEKIIPQKVFSWSNDLIALFINRLFAGDGWYSGGNCNEVGIGSESIQLLFQVKQLLTRFDIDAKFYPATESAMPKLRIFGGKNFANFVEKIGIYGKEPRNHITKGFFFNRIKGQVLSVSPSKETTVYDIRVPPHDNYIVDGAVVHNSGVSTLTGVFALWYAMFNLERTILVVSKRDKDAMDFMRRNIKFPYQNLPDWMKKLWPLLTDNEHRIAFNNGSIIDSLTSSPDTLRSNSASLNIIDEAAFMPKMEDMWAGGQACCALDTQIATHIGMVAFEDIMNGSGIPPGEGAEISGKVYTDDGVKDMSHLYNNGYAETRRIVTQNGYEIECTLGHKLRVLTRNGYEWKEAKEIQVEDTVCLMPGTAPDEDLGFLFEEFELESVEFDYYAMDQKVPMRCYSCLSHFEWIREDYENYEHFDDGFFKCPLCVKTDHAGFAPPEYMSPIWSELIGYFLGGGIISGTHGSFSMLVDARDPEVAARFMTLLEEHKVEIEANLIEDEIIEVTTDNKKLINFFCYHRLDDPDSVITNIKVPPAAMLNSREGLSAFLRGVFEALGSVSPHEGEIQIRVLSEILSRQLQVSLLSLGILCKREMQKRVSKGKESLEYILRILPGENTKKFIAEVGFISDRKRELAANLIIDGIGSFIDHPLVRDFVTAACEHYDQESDEFAKLSIIRDGCALSHQYALNLIDEHPDLQQCVLGKVLKNGLILEKVRSITHDSTFTADLSVPDNHTYIANGFVSHNTMMHGGRCIVISTPNGIGNWYWKTWNGAETNSNLFNPIIINWWDMDWTLKYVDPISKQEVVISPCDGIEDCVDPDDLDRYGPKKSPWLVEQYRQLEMKGEAHLYRQEILAEFLGSGDTVIDRRNIVKMQEDLDDEFFEVKAVNYHSIVTGERTVLDFNRRLRIWERPIRRGHCIKCDRFADGREYCCNHKVPTESHLYSIGVDISTGEHSDFSAIQVINVTTREQVAELQIKVPAKLLARMTDYLGRYYNNAFLVVENVGYGQALVDELHNDLMYPNMYKEQPIGRVNSKRSKKVKLGFTTSWTKKPLLNKALMDCIGSEDHNFVLFRSNRLYQEILTYINLGGGKAGAEPNTGSHDDIVLATGMALFGMNFAAYNDATGLLPFNDTSSGRETLTREEYISKVQDFIDRGGSSMVPPIINNSSQQVNVQEATKEALDKFGSQLSGLRPMTDRAVVPYPQMTFEDGRGQFRSEPVEKKQDRSQMPTVKKQRHVIRIKRQR